MLWRFLRECCVCHTKIHKINEVSMMTDLKNPKLIWMKGVLFLVLGVFASSLLVFHAPSLRVVVLLCLSIWAFCRCYYFAFYVIEHYVDSSYRYAGLISFFRYAVARRANVPKDAPKT